MPGRRKLPVLAELEAPARAEGRPWSLHRADFEALAAVRERLDGRRVVAVSGGEGRAAAGALALAAAASAAGRRTVLLECDLAQPRVAAELGLEPSPGLHEYLRWEAAAPQLLQPLVLAGPAAGGAGEPLVCVVAGQAAPDPGPLLNSGSFQHVTAKLASAYELTVLVAPPLRDTVTLPAVAGRADALLACLAPGEVSGRAGRAVRRAGRRLGPPLLGAIVVGPSR